MTIESPERYRDPDAWPYTFELLDVDWLFVDDRYQRPVTRIANVIAATFDRALLEPLLVSERKNRRYAIADGQNRWEGCKRIGERWLWCRVMLLSPQEEARIFSKLQANRKGITPLERYKADLFAGDEEAVAVDQLLRRHDIHTSDVAGAWSAADAVSAIGAVRDGWRKYGDQHMDRVFETIRAAFPGERTRYAGEVLNGVSAFYVRNADAHFTRTVVALESMGLQEMLTRSAAARTATGGRGMGGASAVYVVRVIEVAYRSVARGTHRASWDFPGAKT